VRKRHDGGAVAARYKHAFGELSVRFFVGQSVRNLRMLTLSASRPYVADTSSSAGTINVSWVRSTPAAIVPFAPATTRLNCRKCRSRVDGHSRLWAHSD
jgi:hypothetical protein